MSNPKSYYDPFGRMAEPKKGWASIDETMDEWETVNGWCLRFDGEKSPNIMAGKTIWKYLLTQEQLEEKRRLLQPTSPEYYRQVRGYFCPTGSVDSIFSETQIVRCNGDKKAIWLEPPIKVAGFDPSFTHGGDRSILYFGQFGITTDHLKTLEWTEYVHIEEDNRDKSAERNFQIARKLRAECEKRGVQCKHLAIDGTGAGKPFCDIVRNVWNGEFLELNFAGGATDLPASGTDPRPSKEAYVNHVSEIWFVGREYLSSNQIRGIGPDLAKELISRTYETKAGGKVQVEPKPLMKGRVGFSPDVADAALLVMAVCRHRLGFGSKFKSGISPRKDNHRSFWSEPEQTKSPFKRFAKKVASLRRF